MQRPKVMIVDDEPYTRGLIRISLEPDYDVLEASDGHSCMSLLEQEWPDLVVLDVLTKGMDGWDTLKRLRAQSNVPIIVVTVRGEVLARVLGLQLGADDFLTKPFDSQELSARVNAVLRRTRRPEHEHDVLQRGALLIDRTEVRAMWKGRTLSLTRKEFKLLARLASQPGQVLLRDGLVAWVWGDEHVVDTRTVDTHIKNIRKELGDGARLIVTERGLGYRFIDPGTS